MIRFNQGLSLQQDAIVHVPFTPSESQEIHEQDARNRCVWARRCRAKRRN